MENIVEWIEHLKHPLVLAGFGLFILAMLLKPIFTNNQNKLSGPAYERLMSKAITFVFILAFLVVVVGFVVSLKSEELENMVNTQQNNTPKTTVAKTIEQNTLGEKSPAIIGHEVQINYGNTYSPQKLKIKPNTVITPKQIEPVQIKQTTARNKSPAIHSSGDVSINYAD